MRNRTMMSGVTALMTSVILSTLSAPTRATSATMTAEPTQAGRPHCCSRLAPVPASITKQMQNCANVME